MACTIAAALTGQPSDLTSVGFWALATTWWMVLNLSRIAMTGTVTARVHRFGRRTSLFTLTSAHRLHRQTASRNNPRYA